MKGERLLHFRQSVSEVTKKPAFVKGRAARIWKQYAGQLNLTLLDEAMFGVWCCLMAEFQESPHTFPAARLAQLRGLGKSFGLTPGGRRGDQSRTTTKAGSRREVFQSDLGVSGKTYEKAKGVVAGTWTGPIGPTLVLRASARDSWYGPPGRYSPRLSCWQ